MTDSRNHPTIIPIVTVSLGSDRLRCQPSTQLLRRLGPLASVLCVVMFAGAARAAGPGVTDCNTNGVDDATDIAMGTSTDCNNNAKPDECEFDCNTNGIPDDCDIAAGTSADANDDQILDECPLVPCADTDVNCDGFTNAGDIGVVQAPLNWSMPQSQAENPRTDVNNDGAAGNAGDLGIIQAPLNWSTSTGPCHSPDCP